MGDLTTNPSLMSTAEQTPSTPAAKRAPSAWTLSQKQVRYYRTFGFLHIKRLFSADVDRLISGFEEAFSKVDNPFTLEGNQYHHTERPEYVDTPRHIIPRFIDQSPDLVWLRSDPRMIELSTTLLGPGVEYAESDGNVFNCDVLYHMDVFGSNWQDEHIKVYFYLDPLTSDTGSLRVIPGTHFIDDQWGSRLRRDLLDPKRAQDRFGVPLQELPAFPIETNPGDVVIGNFRTLHGSFHGGIRRRLFTVNYHKPST